MKSKLLLSFLVSFLLGFMLLIFGPAEIFFGNVTEFEFLYGEFAGYMAIIFVIALLLVTALLTILPDKLHKIMVSIVFGLHWLVICRLCF